jgi:hypothetical protein
LAIFSSYCPIFQSLIENFEFSKIEQNKSNSNAKMSRMTHSASLKSHKLNPEHQVQASGRPSSSAPAPDSWNFAENINQWKKYLEIDEFVSLKIMDYILMKLLN